MIRLCEVFRFEVAYQLRRPSTYLYAGLLLVAAFLLLHGIDGGSSRINSPHAVATLSSLLGMVGMLVSAALFGEAATRDVQTGMHPLIYTAGVRTSEYLGGRFLAALAMNAAMLLAIPMGLLAGSLMPYMDPQMFGPTRPAAYLQPYVLLLLPNVLLVGVVLFTLAALTRQMMWAYLGGIGIFVAYLFMRLPGDQLADRTIAALADPLGTWLLQDLTRYWTPAQLNHELIGYPSLLVWNRLLWVACSALLLIVLHFRFRFAHASRASRRRNRNAKKDAAPSEGVRGKRHATPREFGTRARVHQTLAVARRAWGDIASSRAFLVILLGAVLFTILFGWNVSDNLFGTHTWSVTHLLAGDVIGTTLAPVIVLLIVAFAGELVWRERDLRVSAIGDAAPVPDWVTMLGRFLALVAMLVVLQLVLMGAGVTLQALQGWHRFEIGLYLRVLFGVSLTNYVLLAVMAMAVHVIVNHKFVAHLIVVLCYLFTVFAESLGIGHHLLVYGSEPDWTYSDMSGFGPFVAPIVWFTLYWASWALLLAIVARLFWVRGHDRAILPALAYARARLSHPVLRAGVVAVSLIGALGGFIFYNTNLLNEYRTASKAQSVVAEYERRYKQFQDAPQPRITSATLRVEIYPARRAASVVGTYQLVNDTGQAIDSLHVFVNPAVRTRSLTFDRPARRVMRDDQLPYEIHFLEKGLQPGDVLQLQFDVEFAALGFRNADEPTAVVVNGTFFDRYWLPTLGYQSGLELTDVESRQQQGLPPREPPPSARDVGPGDPRLNRTSERVLVDVVMGTDAEETAVTAGTLVREWRENGRRYFHYQTGEPLPFMHPFFSAQYAVVEDQLADVTLQVFHHPAHTVNVDRMLRSMRASLEYYGRAFGPYPFGQLRVVEFPRYASFARSYPQTIAFSEGSAFLTRVDEGDIDRPFFVVAHETAHQWWGHQLSTANVRGNALLSETLAQYSAMMVMEKALGAEHVRDFYRYEMDGYLHGRSVFSSTEVPLLDVENHHDHLSYHKGALAMYTLREHVGEDAVNEALRRFLARQRPGVPPNQTSLDLYRELQVATPVDLHPLLHDLFADVILWDVRAESARAEPTGSGSWRLTLEVQAAKLRADGAGNETSVPMNDLVEIGVFADPADGASDDAPLYLRQHRIRDGRQTITVEVSRRPAHVGIDPYAKLIQREASDNVVAVLVDAGL
jgi:ABC-2 type transport system permease protein